MGKAPPLPAIGQAGNGAERSPQNSISRKTTEILVTLLFLRPLHKHAKHNGRVEVQPYAAGKGGNIPTRIPLFCPRRTAALFWRDRESEVANDHGRLSLRGRLVESNINSLLNIGGGIK
ncbi:hypothetical protein AVEN_202077-1 [Araneus ventricosus]|uniref:Uncharacterized protein n=1 Tax=Araneus ventricosus TaxID=182803 RepID=A0A4Y2KYD8_ARAVE|nr:hypothetical protein AVEN_202077-1 [Araneus ventricosus]